ncbi:hypothetical protein OA067_04240 [Gammaproteobacteria bacterium]|nr:hypothetical protein [Gammaproteobacteria bacterium]
MKKNDRLILLIAFFLGCIGASSTVQAADATSFQINQSQRDKLRSEMMENGIAPQAIEKLLAAFTSIDVRGTSYANEMKGFRSIREARIALNNDRERKSRVGWALVDVVKNQGAFPLKLDESTWYTGLHYDREKEALIYHYTIVNLETAKLFKENLDAAREYLIALNPDAVCQASLDVLALGFDLVYSYREPNQAEILSVSRTYEGCERLGFSKK